MDRAEGVEFYRQKKTSIKLLLFFKDKAKYKKDREISDETG